MFIRRTVLKSIPPLQFHLLRRYTMATDPKLATFPAGSPANVGIDGAAAEMKRPGSPTDLKTQPKKKARKPKKYKAKPVDPTSPAGVLQFEIDELLREQGLSRVQVETDVTPILNDVRGGPMQQKYNRRLIDVHVLKLTSSGDGLAIVDSPEDSNKKQLVLVPFGLPGDVVTIQVHKTHPHYAEASLLEVQTSAEMRHDDLINCKYFGKCSGCQYQFLTYDQQLQLKQRTVSNAFKFFAPQLLAEGLLPTVGETVASPLQFAYRTKLTPHFDMPRKVKQLETRPPLGFGQKGRPTWRHSDAGGSAAILDIEDCPIGTEIIRRGMRNERARFEETFKNYKKGATILLREHTKVLNPAAPVEEQLDPGSCDPVSGQVSHLRVDADPPLLKLCTTNTRQIVTEYVDGCTFEFSAGEFFQNNSSILPVVTAYVRDNVRIPNSGPEDKHYLVDAYCGSGLFSITASKGVDRVIGVEVSADSVAFAERNAKTNGVTNCTFIVGKAEKIFASIDTPCDRTSVILDPPRKGCDDVFLKQLAEYNPARIVYISCNVHSQARDVQYFLKETPNGARYKVDSIRGFDFFPQTHHVEGVCVLSRD
ncbi:ACR256Cp [Eremothecium gossypii ATCC 10895]|uniref:tRNA (uracil(54)-C(5))-methyltransferase n=1 Tax=Eremothecium gossypii (strain ATCC 10895 / CBS 109.51 / FGSC 9923 / NRRL Y-1056) TaxID=284811 RepID=Q75BL5_EREGS|nr:ACR256Cp [Eremothecium gossypii ATCC 10895]AAS51482.1 ACR256Cp [Eremothecium gossypii ATCC 10895]